MDISQFVSAVDIGEIEDQIKIICDLAIDENKKVELLPGETSCRLILDVQPKDVFCYRVTLSEIPDKKIFIPRTIGKYSLQDLKNILPGQDDKRVEGKIRKILPVLSAANGMIPLKKGEMKVQLMLNIQAETIKGYQIIVGVEDEKLYISRIINEIDLNEYIK